MPKIQPQVPKEFTQRAPPEPHLALFRKEHGEAPYLEGIPTGAVMAIVLDPTNPQRGIFPIAIVKVTNKRLEFKCPCGQKNCTRRVVFNGTWSGLHPNGTSDLPAMPK